MGRLVGVTRKVATQVIPKWRLITPPPLLASTALMLALACARVPSRPSVDEGEPTPPTRPSHHQFASVLIAGVPHVQQKPDFCGEAATESWLKALGSPITQDQVFSLSGTNPERGRGATTREMIVALSRLGFDTGPAFAQVAKRADSALDAQFSALHADLERRIPSIVCMHYDDRRNASEHFRLVLGYDAATDEVIYHEPAHANAAYERMDRRQFLSLWPLKYDPKIWTIIRLRLAGGNVPSLPAVSEFTPADYAQHVMQLHQGKARGFRLVVEHPFVVVGNSATSELRGFAEHTIRFAVSRLKRDFFPKDPGRILDIWLFRESTSYESNALRLFGSSPTTPYGYYSSEHNALVMNIATGGGTLVHEIVHPFIEANFPNCPAWFNEGLGSLFEQSADRDGHIVGLTNWRLAGLQQRIRRAKLATLASLLATTPSEFYGKDQASNYGQARYLLYYLQEHGLLVRYYKEFAAHQTTDPTGLATLKQVLNEPDISAFQRRWEDWVLNLRFPEPD